MKWITRQNANVDRVACPWLIKRFIDTDAEFLFASKDDVITIAERESAIPYDVPDVELGHVDGRCSFDSIVLKYALDQDPAMVMLAKIVHAADVSVDIDTAREGAGLLAIAQGFALIHGLNDHKKIELETPMYDALYRWCQHKTKAN
ncbi:MAG: chromate resistance protein [Candidatus Obscuribacterales bacterium]